MAVARRYKTIGFSVPPMIAERIDAVVRERQFTRSELFREMFRLWEKENRRDPDSDEAIMRLFAEVKEQERRNPTPEEESLKFFQELGKDLRKRAKKRGLIVTEDGEILEKQAV